MTSPRRFPSPRNDAQSASLSGLAGWRFLAFLSANRPSGADAHYGPGATRTINVEDLGPQGGPPFPCILATELKTHCRVYGRPIMKRGSNPMSEPNIAVYDEEVFSDELPDETLEVAGSKCWEGRASSFTVAFCSGIDTCPSYPAR